MLSFPKFSPVVWEFSCVKRGEFELLLLVSSSWDETWSLWSKIEKRKHIWSSYAATKLNYCTDIGFLLTPKYLEQRSILITKRSVKIKFKVVSGKAQFLPLNTGISYAKVPVLHTQKISTEKQNQSTWPFLKLLSNWWQSQQNGAAATSNIRDRLIRELAFIKWKKKQYTTDVLNYIVSSQLIQAAIKFELKS